MNTSERTIGPSLSDHEDACCLVLTQDRRGHGQTTFAWYLARALVEAGLRVLVIDVTGHRERLATLSTAATIKNLGAWLPAQPRPEQLSALLASAFQQTRGHVDVLLVDGDAALLESAGGFALPIDYALALVDPTEADQRAADHLAERLGDALPPHGRLGVIFCRADPNEADHFPQQTEGRHLPILGYFPADYLLANDEGSRPGIAPAEPHADYLQAVARLGRMLILRMGLRRILPPPSTTD